VVNSIAEAYAMFLAISGLDYLNLYPEFLLNDVEKKAFEKDRNSAIVS